MTAIFTDDNSAQQAYSLGAVDFLTKPLDESVLKTKVAALTSHYRQLDTIQRQAQALRDTQRQAEREHRARAEAEAANRAKDQFLAALSHELRAPLSSILGWSSALQARDDVPPDVAKGLHAIARSARTQAQLIDELLDLSQLVAAKVRLAAAAVDLASVTHSALATMAPAAEAKRIRVDVDIAPHEYRIVGDAARLEQLLCALVSNAIKFSSTVFARGTARGRVATGGSASA